VDHGVLALGRPYFSVDKLKSQNKDEVLPSYNSMVKEIAGKIEDRLWNGD
jgi:hypothetical protein